MPDTDEVDILIITALDVEFEAAKRVALASDEGPGVRRWTPCGQDSSAPYEIGEHVDQHGDLRSLAIARLDRMGGRGVGTFVTALVERLRPACLAMSGICAGNPDKVGLGDVVVAELAYEYDEGKLTAAGFDPDIRQMHLDVRWVRAARDLRPETLRSHCAATPEAAEIWFLEQLLSGGEPREHPAHSRYFTEPAWSTQPAALAKSGLVARASGGGWQLTDVGRQHVEAVRYDRSGGPQRLPFKVVVGPMASGSGVVADGQAWRRLCAQGVRSVVAMEMEAATIATVAQDLRVPHWLVAKGVVDHADPRKDDRHREFAAQASAEVLLDLLVRLVPARPDGGRSGAEWLDRLRGAGLIVWEPADVAAAMSSGKLDDKAQDDDAADLPVNDIVDVSLIREGSLSGVGPAFDGLVKACKTWLTLDHRKRGAGTRILWLVGEPGQIRSRALLASLAGAGDTRLDILDAGRMLGLAARAIDAATLTSEPVRPAVVGIDLPAEADWDELRETLVRLRRLGNRRRHPYPPLMLGGTAAQEQRAYDLLGSLVEITPVDLMGRPHQRPNSETGTEGMASDHLKAEHVYNRGLPVTGSELFGRVKELSRLRAAWDDPGTRILAVVAPGGVGKSALINEWLREMRRTDYQGAQKVLAWSFYSQGTRDTTVPADPFIAFALDWLGDKQSEVPLPDDAGPVERGIRLAELVRRQPMLLVLDGMEPLQYPDSAPANIARTFTDAAITTLLEEIAKPGGAGGLCLVTTRVPLPPLDTDVMAGGGPVRSPVTTVELGKLDDQAGAALLQHQLGLPYPFDDLQAIVQKVRGHALALNLLGRYLREFHAGKLAGHYDLDRLDQAVPDGGHARRIMDLSVKWLRKYDCDAALAVLDLVGLFDRPAQPDAMDAVLTRTTLGERVAGLDRVGGPIWDEGVAQLRRLGLLDEPMPALPGALDAHPLVRGYSRDRLRQHDRTLWDAGHLALFEHYQWRAPERPGNAGDMSLLYAAVSHGCAIGRHQEVFDLIVLPRIWRNNEFFSTRKLGLTGSEMVALSNYFHHEDGSQLTQWQRLGVALSPKARTQILSSVALRLRQIGRLSDARKTCETLLNEVPPEDDDCDRLGDAAFAAGLLCELLVLAGQLQGASDVATRAIEYAERSGIPYFRMYSRTCLAEAMFMLGDTGTADALFAEAQAIAGERPFLYSQVLYRYGYHLIESGRLGELPPPEAPEEWGLDPKDSSRLSPAIRRLILAAAQRARYERHTCTLPELLTARPLLDRAVAECRSVGYGDYIVRSLLERIHFAVATGLADHYERATADLHRATVEVGRGELDLLATDVELLRAALELAHFGTRTEPERAEASAQISRALGKAIVEVKRLGYQRRRDLLKRLREWATELGIN